MRTANFTTPIQVYFPPHMVEAARDRARQDGRTLSELMRHALRRELADAA